MRRIGETGNAAGGLAGRRGNFAVLFGVLVPTLALSAGFALNTAQLLNARSALREATDAAAAATARDLAAGVITPADAATTASAFLEAGGADIDRHGQIVVDRLILDRMAGTVQVTAHVDVVFHLPLFGGKAGRVSSTSAAACFVRSTTGGESGRTAISTSRSRTRNGGVKHFYRAAEGAESGAIVQGTVRKVGWLALTG